MNLDGFWGTERASKALCRYIYAIYAYSIYSRIDKIY